jgi:glycosyltransferase involved in cell wall biosynthesis
MAVNPIDLSLVVPLFNEQENVGPLDRSIMSALQGSGCGFEVIFVDDGSTDQTAELLRRLHKQDPRVRVIRLFINSGQTAAMGIGIQSARGNVIVTMDGDLQNDPRDIPLLLAKIHAGSDLVVGWRKHRQDKLFSRRIPSRIANWWIASLLGLRTHDLGCTLKAYRAELIQQVPLYSDLHRFITAVCSLASTRIDEVVVRHHPRHLGKSKYGIGRTGKVMLDVLMVKMLLSCSRRPLHWFGSWAFVSFMISIAITLGSIAWHDDGASSFVLLGAAMLLGCLSLHLLFSGILAELVVRTQADDRVKPLADVEVSSK